MSWSRDKGLYTVKKLTVRWKQESMSDRLLLKINVGEIIQKPINSNTHLSRNKCVKFWIIQNFQPLKVLSDFCRISLIFDLANEIHSNILHGILLEYSDYFNSSRWMLKHQEGTQTSFLQNVAQIQDSRCHVSSLDLFMLLNFSEMKIQRLAANNTDPLGFYVNDTTQQSQKDLVGIELPSEALKGKS